MIKVKQIYGDLEFLYYVHRLYCVDGNIVIKEGDNTVAVFSTRDFYANTVEE